MRSATLEGDVYELSGIMRGHLHRVPQFPCKLRLLLSSCLFELPLILRPPAGWAKAKLQEAEVCILPLALTLVMTLQDVSRQLFSNITVFGGMPLNSPIFPHHLSCSPGCFRHRTSAPLRAFHHGTRTACTIPWGIRAQSPHPPQELGALLSKCRTA